MRTHSLRSGRAMARRAITSGAGSRLLPVTSQRQVTVPRQTGYPVNEFNASFRHGVPSAAPAGTPSLAGQVTGGVHVTAHLLDQRLDRVELQGIPQPGGELHADVL